MIDTIGLSNETLLSQDRKKSIDQAASELVAQVYGQYDDDWSELTDWAMECRCKNGPVLEDDEVQEVKYAFGVLSELAEQAEDDGIIFGDLFNEADNVDEVLRRGVLLKGAECMILNRLVERLVDRYQVYPF